MSLENTFINGFKQQATQLGLTLEQQGERSFSATGDKQYLALEILEEQYGMAHVIFAQVTIILGDYQKALDVLGKEPEEGKKELADSSFDLYSSQEDVSQETLGKLEEFTGLASKFYHCPEFTIFTQKGTHDLFLKDPITIGVLRGKKKMAEVIEQIQSLSLPTGWLIQKPKGLGKESTNQAWKLIGIIVTILFALAILLILLTKGM